VIRNGKSSDLSGEKSVSESHYLVVFILGVVFQGIFHSQWSWVFVSTWIPLVSVFYFLDRYIPRKLTINELQIQIGRVKVSSSQLEWIDISIVDHRISMEFFLDDRDIRNIHRPRIRVQPIDRGQVLYEELATWANHHQIQVKGWHQV